MKLPKKHADIPLAEVLQLCLDLEMFTEHAAIRHDPPKKPFRWDGCTWFPDRVGDVDTDLASLAHDLRYWSGRKGDKAGRFRADLMFALDLLDKCGASVALAQTMFEGVRMGGTLPHRGRWGYGR